MSDADILDLVGLAEADPDLPDCQAWTDSEVRCELESDHDGPHRAVVQWVVTPGRRALLDALMVERYGRPASPSARLADASAEAAEWEPCEGCHTLADPDLPCPTCRDRRDRFPRHDQT